jgi:hypothetical protein
VKKILYLAFLLSFLNAASDGDQRARNIIQTTIGGGSLTEDNAPPGYDPYGNDESFRREAVYGWILLNDSKKIPGMTPGKTTMVNFVAENKTTDGDNKATNNKTITILGFCLIRDDIFIEKQPGALKVDCQTNIGGIVMFANLKALNNLNSLVVDPVFIEYKGARYQVDSSIVTNEAQTSYNIATYVNDRKIAEIGWSTLGVASDEVKVSSNRYLQALEDAREKEEIAYVNVPSGANNSYPQAVTTTNIDKPKASDYVIGAGINILASAVKTTAEIFRNDLPYLYEILGGTKIYVDMQVRVKGERIE